jgi:hypothetical protein
MRRHRTAEWAQKQPPTQKHEILAQSHREIAERRMSECFFKWGYRRKKIVDELLRDGR